MAKAAWCTVTPTSGKENGTINISAAAHTGRTERSTSVLVQAANGTRPSANIAVNQAGAAVSTTMDTTKPDVPAAGGTLVINGTSNSSKLIWSIADQNGISQLPIAMFGNISVKVNNVEITSNTAIAGDPGAVARYSFITTFVLKASSFPVDVPCAFKITDDSGVVNLCKFTYKAGASRLTASKSTLSLANTGEAQTVEVSSNDDWTVSYPNE